MVGVFIFKKPAPPAARAFLQQKGCRVTACSHCIHIILHIYFCPPSCIVRVVSALFARKAKPALSWLSSRFVPGIATAVAAPLLTSPRLPAVYSRRRAYVPQSL